MGRPANILFDFVLFSDLEAGEICFGFVCLRWPLSVSGLLFALTYQLIG